MPAEFHYQTRIYYEDTDFGGVVYYANYLKYAERARTEMLRSIGMDQKKFSEEEKIFFMVKKCQIDFKASASLDDKIDVRTFVKELKGASILLKQEILIKEKLITDIDVLIVSVNNKNMVVKLPSKIKNLLNK